MARRYTPEQHAWIREHYAGLSNAELAAAFSERFGIDLTPSCLHAYGSNHGLRKGPGVRERALRTYTDEENEWLRGFIPGHTETEIVDAFEERFGRRLEVYMVANRKVALGVRSGTHGGRFEPGSVPFNKGMRWEDFGTPEGHERSRATCFKRGELNGIAAERKRPLLDIREGKDGYLQIKVAPRDARYPMRNWIGYAQFVWMQANGREWPKGHRAVFADHDNRNFDPGNIVPVPADLYAIVVGAVKGGLEWHDRGSLEAAMTMARVIRARRRLERCPNR